MKALLRLLISLVFLVGLMVPVSSDQGSLCMPTSGTVTGLAFSQNVNTALQALVTSNSGATEPGNPCTTAAEQGQFWLDTSGAEPALKYYDGADWQTFGTVDTATGIWTPPVGGGAGSIASAGTTDLWSVPQSYVTVSGTTTITQLSTSASVLGTQKNVVFSGSLTLTYNATSLILPGGINIITQAGDRAQVVSLGGNNAAVINFTRASGAAIIAAPSGHVDQFLLAACPATYVQPNGSTIGSASSGGTLRANADTAQLFAAMWALDATVSPIFTSVGAGSTRGASAAADFAANKRLTVPDMRGTFLRSLDDSRGIDTARLLGSEQADDLEEHDHDATFVGDALAPHAHSYIVVSPGSAVGNVNGSNFGGAGSTTGSTSGGTPTGTVTVDPFGGDETRPINTAVLTCVKL